MSTTIRRGDLLPEGTFRYAGRDGLGRLSVRARYTSTNPDSFRGEILRTSFDHVSLEVLRGSAHDRLEDRGTTDPEQSAVALIYLVSGDIDLLQPASIHLGRGSVLLTRIGEPLEYESTTPMQVVRIVVGDAHFPAYLRSTGSLPVSRLPPTRLLRAAIAFIEELASAPPVATRQEAEHLAQVIAGLTVAVSMQAAERSGPGVGAPALRRRIQTYIHLHLAKPGLSAPTIAEALDVSVRTVHLAFSTAEDSVTQYIRNARLDAVAEAVRSERESDRVGDLADRFGFSSGDQLTRLFRARFGMTVASFRKAVLPSADRRAG